MVKQKRPPPPDRAQTNNANILGGPKTDPHGPKVKQERADPRAPCSNSPEPTEAIVESLGFDVAHDSDGLLILTLLFPNGGRSDLQLEGEALSLLLARLGLDQPEELVGRRFSELAPALPANSGK
jgi:hypothetical protein